jgi:hypothetical protein
MFHWETPADKSCVRSGGTLGSFPQKIVRLFCGETPNEQNIYFLMGKLAMDKSRGAVSFRIALALLSQTLPSRYGGNHPDSQAPETQRAGLS